MKLELKHLAPYFPYGLKMAMTYDSIEDYENIDSDELCLQKGSVWELYLLTTDSIEFFGGECDDFALKNDTFRIANNGTLKPILRPLSDLTKEIEHISYTKDLEPNLTKIIPEDFFRKHWFLSIREDGHFSTDNGDGTCTGYTYKSASYDIIILLLEWHFDIYGLIKNGLAIDINTLYKSE